MVTKNMRLNVAIIDQSANEIKKKKLLIRYPNKNGDLDAYENYKALMKICI